MKIQIIVLHLHQSEGNGVDDPADGKMYNDLRATVRVQERGD